MHACMWRCSICALARHACSGPGGRRLGPNHQGRWEGPSATCCAIGGPGARCFGHGMGPCSTHTRHSQFWRCRKPGQLPETRDDCARVGLLVLWGAYGPAIPPMLASVLEVKTIVDLTPPCFCCDTCTCIRYGETLPTARAVDPRRRVVGAMGRCIPCDASAVADERKSRTERPVLAGEAGYIPCWSSLCHVLVIL